VQKNFLTALTFTLHYEGGFVNDPRDPGGATNKGITLATYRADVDPHGTVASLIAMSTKTAGEIYRKHYWTQINADALAGGVDMEAFDIAVNMGVGRARQFLAQTIGLAPAQRLRQLHILRMGFWKRLATWAHFGKGWTAREVACYALATRLLGG
jgi:lysozyme family protein